MLEMVEIRKGAHTDDGKWIPRIISDVYDGYDYGYEIVIVEVKKATKHWWEQALSFVKPRPEPIIISQTGIDLFTALDSAKRLHVSPWGIEIENSGYNICVRTHYPLRLLRQIIDGF